MMMIVIIATGIKNYTKNFNMNDDGLELIKSMIANHINCVYKICDSTTNKPKLVSQVIRC